MERKKRMNWIGEENYEQTMRSTVEPYLADRRETGTIERIFGQKLYYEHFRTDQPKGVIVISFGFTSSIQKYSESIYYMLQAGYDVWCMEHRGHGKSYRHVQNPFVVHVEHFQDYVLDQEYFTRTKVKPAAGNHPLYLFCHSMGGCIGAWLIEDQPDLFQKAVLSSPMLGLDFGKIPMPLMLLGAQVKGIGEKKKEPLDPINAFPGPNFEGSCESSECRYWYYYSKRISDESIQTISPSIGWGIEAMKACLRVTDRRHAAQIRIPVLLFQAGDDTIVKNSSQDLFFSRIKDGEFIKVPGIKHEIYMADSPVLKPYWEKIFSFYD